MGNKRVTSFDVARRAGVSRSVVSAVLNGTPGIGVSSETRAAVLEAIRELNYHVDAQARAMKTGLSHCLAAFGSTRNPLFLQLLEGMQKACAERDYHILISGQSASEQDRYGLLSLYLQRRIDGIITLDETSYRSAAWAAEIQQAHIPYVSVEGYTEIAGVASVLVDYAGSVTTALDYLCRGGGPAPIYVEVYGGASRGNWAECSRREAYAKWCGEKGFAPRMHQMEFADEAGLAGLLESLHREPGGPPPFLLNWSGSAGPLYREAWRLGLQIGTDFRIMCADNTLRGSRYMVPTLSAMDIPYIKMGEAAVECLLEQIAGTVLPGEADKRWLQATLVPGESA